MTVFLWQIGLLPQNEPFEKLISLDDRGYADSDESCETKTRGDFCRGRLPKEKGEASYNGGGGRSGGGYRGLRLS